MPVNHVDELAGRTVRRAPDGPPVIRGIGSARATSALDVLAINTIRTLAIDAVQQANSGHPGTPMAMAPVGYTLWQRFLRFDPEDPDWPNRDRFVLSMGHASMLLYALLHLSGVKHVAADGRQSGEPAVTLDDIQRFRQLGSKCPGHPEYGMTAGVETTTGPLGQGAATSVGMAIAERWLADRFNCPDFPLFDYRVYALCSDGDMMEGVSGEAASLAGHLKLSNLCWIYDNNRITIEGNTALAFSEDVAERFLGYGWNVLREADANDCERLAEAIATAGRTGDRPTLIIVDSHIGYGAPHKQDSSAVHGDPLGEEEVRLTKRRYGWPEEARFLVPDGVREHFAAGIGQRGRALRKAWKALFEGYRARHPDLADQLLRLQAQRLPDGWEADIPSFASDPEGLSGREASGKVLNAVAPRIPWLLGGSADLGPSTKTRLLFDGAGDFEADAYGGRNFHFGIREHAMGAICNGLALSKLRPFASGYLIFSDYMKPAIRLAALMEAPVAFVFTHDSIGVGEDGPTHQPVEQLLGLRGMPGLLTLRPADANEVAEAWRLILSNPEPACLVLSRQPLPVLDRARYASAAGLARGAYILADPPDGAAPDLILMATGSEVSLVVEVHERLVREGIRSRVVSMPCWEMFERQDRAYRESVLPPALTARVAVEQATTIGWDRYVGPTGIAIGMHTFGASAPLKALLTKFGFTPERILHEARAQAERSRSRT